MMLGAEARTSLAVVENTGSALELRNTVGNIPPMAAEAHGPICVAPVIVQCDLSEIVTGVADALGPLVEANHQQVHRQLELECHGFAGQRAAEASCVLDTVSG